MYVYFCARILCGMCLVDYECVVYLESDWFLRYVAAKAL